MFIANNYTFYTFLNYKEKIYVEYKLISMNI